MCKKKCPEYYFPRFVEANTFLCKKFFILRSCLKSTLWELYGQGNIHPPPEYKEYTGCSGKIVFFHNSLQPLPRLHRCKSSSKLSTQSKCTVTPIDWQFFVQPIAVECWRGRGGKLSRILGMKHNI